jgi:hypothetical protein
MRRTIMTLAMTAGLTLAVLGTALAGAVTPAGATVRHAAASAPASAPILRPLGAATVRGPAIPDAPCSGHPEDYIYNVPGQWQVPSSGGNAGVVTDSASREVAFCIIAGANSSWNALRQYGTSNCATWDSGTNTVKMEGCDPSSVASQNWAQEDEAGRIYLVTEYSVDLDGTGYVLTGKGGDTPVFFSDVCGTTTCLNQQSWGFTAA